jgi:2-polyprenyl-6-hydroxyphenyl methylase / 3-demethylubiquinone-9 3-methyltransferase
MAGKRANPAHPNKLRKTLTPTINNHIYDELANTWWDPNKVLHLLKAMVNPWRVPYFKDVLTKEYGEDLRDVRMLDVGCGGGVLSEEFASIGCKVTGIDPSLRSIRVAQAHTATSGLSINYKVGSGISLPFANGSFDVVSCCDVLEHIRDWRLVITELNRVLVPGGLFLFDTINRTLLSRVAFIYVLQVIPFTKLMPRDTHVWELFIRPDELTTAIEQNGMMVKDMKGGKIARNPISMFWDIGQQKSGHIHFGELGRRLSMRLDGDLSLNYLGFARKSVQNS